MMEFISIKLKNEEDIFMLFEIAYNMYEPGAGCSIHTFSEELIRQQKKSNTDIIGVFNGIELRVNHYENPMSLYWQYMYKMEVKRCER